MDCLVNTVMVPQFAEILVSRARFVCNIAMCRSSGSRDTAATHPTVSRVNSHGPEQHKAQSKCKQQNRARNSAVLIR